MEKHGCLIGSLILLLIVPPIGILCIIILIIMYLVNDNDKKNPKNSDKDETQILYLNFLNTPNKIQSLNKLIKLHQDDLDKLNKEILILYDVYNKHKINPYKTNDTTTEQLKLLHDSVFSEKIKIETENLIEKIKTTTNRLKSLKSVLHTFEIKEQEILDENKLKYELELERIKLKQRKLEIRQVYKNKIKTWIKNNFNFQNIFLTFLFIFMLCTIFYFCIYIQP